MAKQTSKASKDMAGDGAGHVEVGETAPKRVEVLNLAALRAQRSARRPVIVDQNGVEHDLAGLSLDAYLAILEIETDFAGLAAEERTGKVGRARQVALITRMQETITAVLPSFPVGGLFLEELYMVAQAIQQAVMPSGIKENEADAEPGKST